MMSVTSGDDISFVPSGLFIWITSFFPRISSGAIFIPPWREAQKIGRYNNVAM